MAPMQTCKKQCHAMPCHAMPCHAMPAFKYHNARPICNVSYRYCENKHVACFRFFMSRDDKTPLAVSNMDSMCVPGIVSESSPGQLLFSFDEDKTALACVFSVKVQLSMVTFLLHALEPAFWLWALESGSLRCMANPMSHETVISLAAG